MRVTREKEIQYPFATEDMFNDGTLPRRKKYTGEVIGTNTSFWYGKTITVATDDGSIIEVNQDIVRVI